MFLIKLIFIIIFLFKINMIASTKESDKGKSTISKSEWLEKLNETKVSKEYHNKLIMNFFEVEGYHSQKLINSIYNRL